MRSLLSVAAREGAREGAKSTLTGGASNVLSVATGPAVFSLPNAAANAAAIASLYFVPLILFASAPTIPLVSHVSAPPIP